MRRRTEETPPSPSARAPISVRSPISVKELYEDLSSELWQVQPKFGSPKLMTIDEIDTAFKRDALGRDTLLRRAGTTTWKTLGAIVGPEEPAETDSLMPFATDVALSPERAARLGLGAAERLPTELPAARMDLAAPSIPKPPALPTLPELPWFPVVNELEDASLGAGGRDRETERPPRRRVLASPAGMLLGAFVAMFVTTGVALTTLAPRPPASAAAPRLEPLHTPPVEPAPVPEATAELTKEPVVETSAVLVLVPARKAKAPVARPRPTSAAPALPPNPFAPSAATGKTKP